MQLNEFISTYANELGHADYLAHNSNFSLSEYRELVATRMTKNILFDSSRHDYLKYNDAMRRAARKFGIKTTRELKEVLRGE